MRAAEYTMMERRPPPSLIVCNAALIEEKNNTHNELSGLMVFPAWDLSVSLTQQGCTVWTTQVTNLYRSAVKKTSRKHYDFPFLRAITRVCVHEYNLESTSV